MFTRFPKWALLGVLVCAALSAVASLGGRFQAAASPEAGFRIEGGPLVLLALLLAAPIGVWLEDSAWNALKRQSRGVRLGGSFALPLVALGLAPVAGVVAGAPTGFLGDGGTMGLAATSTLLWAGSAAVGSLVVLVLDSLVAKVFRSFEARLIAVMSALMGGGSLGAVACMAFAFEMTERVRASNPADVHVDVGGGALSPGEVTTLLGTSEGRWAFIVGFAALAVFPALPAVISACSKLGRTVTDRIDPLASALRNVAGGDFAVRVVEDGPAEFEELARNFNSMAGSLEMASRMERAFGRYTSPQLLERIRAQHGAAEIPAASREASVLFADIRGFTAMSERLAPGDVLAVLNRYFGEVVPVIHQHEGYLDKFIGDAVVVVFNGPVDQADHAARASSCGLAIQEVVARMNAEGRFDDVGGLRVGVGVATGPLVAGNLGGAGRMEYTVIGDTVNLAARLTSKAEAGAVYASERTVAGLAPGICAEALPAVALKGKEQPVVPYRIARAV